MMEAKMDYLDTITAHMNNLPLPPLGDATKNYTVTLSEPEINAIHASAGFFRAVCLARGLSKFWGHYSSTLEGLSEKLVQFETVSSVNVGGKLK